LNFNYSTPKVLWLPEQSHSTQGRRTKRGSGVLAGRMGKKMKADEKRITVNLGGEWGASFGGKSKKLKTGGESRQKDFRGNHSRQENSGLDLVAGGKNCYSVFDQT